MLGDTISLLITTNVGCALKAGQYWVYGGGEGGAGIHLVVTKGSPAVATLQREPASAAVAQALPGATTAEMN